VWLVRERDELVLGEKEEKVNSFESSCSHAIEFPVVAMGNGSIENRSYLFLTWIPSERRSPELRSVTSFSSAATVHRGKLSWTIPKYKEDFRGTLAQGSGSTELEHLQCFGSTGMWSRLQNKISRGSIVVVVAFETDVQPSVVSSINSDVSQVRPSLKRPPCPTFCGRG
jgi:hypothetical protein